jgi:hypothetical protein
MRDRKAEWNEERYNYYRNGALAIEDCWRQRAAGIRCPDPRPPAGVPLGRVVAPDEWLHQQYELWKRRQRRKDILWKIVAIVGFIATAAIIASLIAW